MLIETSRHRLEDLAAWRRLEKEDEAWASTGAFRDRCFAAIDVIRAAARMGGCYVSTSWGKDSVVVSHLAWTLGEEDGIWLPMAWVRTEPVVNPYCHLVRDAFFERWLVPVYHEETVVLSAGEDHDVQWDAALAAIGRRYGDRWIGGMRASESCQRVRRMELGLSLARSVQPIGHWAARDVFAYLSAFDLPVHPAYAFSFGGSLDRDNLRVAALLGGDGMVLEERGTERGRSEWEAVYYGENKS